MNYLEAVRELTTNPDAIAITFKTDSGIERRIVMEQYNYPQGTLTRLYFPKTETKPKRVVLGNCVEFLLREDFQIEYKSKLMTKEDVRQMIFEILEDFTSRDKVKGRTKK